jgi:DNA modification methylase
MMRKDKLLQRVCHRSLSAAQQLPWRIQMVPIAKLRASARKIRNHSNAQILAISKSIKHFGMMSPVIIDDSLTVVVGTARLEAARHLGSSYIPAISASHLTPTEIRAYALADNKLAEKAGWDREALAIELEELQIALPEIGLDLEATGFEAHEIDSTLMDFTEGAGPGDEIPETNTAAIVSRPGDLFVLNQHRVLVADARTPLSYQQLMTGTLAQMAFLDPPYNVPVKGHVGGRGRTKHREFLCASGEMASDEFAAFLEGTTALCAANSHDGAVHFVCMDWRHAGEILKAGASVYGRPLNICIWVKTNAGQGSFYRSQHELVFVFKRGNAPHINTFELGQHGRSRSNVWRYAGVNTFRAGRMNELRMHPTVKPIALVADTIRDCSRRGAIVLDAFAGSGTTVMAAEQLGRRAFCMEIDPAYVDVIIRRWQRFTGRDAVLEGTSRTFDELQAERLRRPQTSIGRPRKPPESSNGAS